MDAIGRSLAVDHQPVAGDVTSLGAELRLVNRWSVGARFDGEFANRSQGYAGTGTIRYDHP
jgi:hypothetical protein